MHALVPTDAVHTTADCDYLLAACRRDPADRVTVLVGATGPLVVVPHGGLEGGR